jgi:hypothetical protein
MAALVVDDALIAHFHQCEELCMLTGDFERALQYRIFAQQAKDGVLWEDTVKEGADEGRV